MFFKSFSTSIRHLGWIGIKLLSANVEGYFFGQSKVKRVSEKVELADTFCVAV